jgi:hypothetical protein
MPQEPVTSTEPVQQGTRPRTETCPFCEGHGCPECGDLGTVPVLEPRPNVPGKSVRPPAAAPLIEVGTTPRGYTLYRQENRAGGHTYWCNDIGGGRVVWDTCLDDFAILAQVLALEDVRRIGEALAHNH